MGSYNSKYENYYNELINKRYNGSDNSYHVHNDEDKGIFDKNKLVKKITFQLTGSTILFLFAFTCRFVVTPETKLAYNFAKTTVNYNFDYKNAIQYVQSVNWNDLINKYKYINSDYINQKSTTFIDEIKSRISGTKTIDDEIKSDFSSPVTGEITSHFGNKIGSAKDKTVFNNGVDINIIGATDVKCVSGGTVVDVGDDKTRGKYIQVDHGEGIETKYYGFSSITVSKGTAIKQNQVIGKVGSKGASSITNFHFEISYMGEDRDPEKYFNFK